MIALLLCVASLSAQPNKNKKEHLKFSPEQLAEIRTKQMTLHLELTNNQQQQLKVLLKEQAILRKGQKEKRVALRKNEVKLNTDQKYQLVIERLDTQLAFQDDIKKVLNEKQFETWKKGKGHRMQKKKQRKGMHHKRKPVNGGRKG